MTSIIDGTFREWGLTWRCARRGGQVIVENLAAGRDVERSRGRSFSNVANERG
jgi:hypothetical protein